MKKILLLLLIIPCAISVTYGQNVGINTNGAVPNSSALLDLTGGVTNGSKGLLPPQVQLTSTSDAATITTPATGLIVYNSVAAGVAPTNVVVGYYYNAGTPAAPNWVAFNGKTHVVLSEALQPPNPLASGDGQTFGYGGWLRAWTPATAVDFHILSNAGEGEYYATTAQTITGLKVTGWVLNDDHSTFTTNVTMYLMKYSLGTAAVADWQTTTIVGTALGTQAITLNPTNNAAGQYDVEPVSMNIGTVTLAQGDVLIMYMESNNVGTYLYYGQTQVEFYLYN
ncbi:MAG TPA: hypothetical protein VNY36_08590 [Bacteroidia bacterium]|jgi:hypothetical protein|nr:hypothetical protein [Bacteroidia bacterium]